MARNLLYTRLCRSLLRFCWLQETSSKHRGLCIDQAGGLGFRVPDGLGFRVQDDFKVRVWGPGWVRV